MPGTFQKYDERLMKLIQALLKMAAANFSYRLPISDAKDWIDTVAMLINKANIRLNKLFHEMKMAQVYVRPRIVLLLNSKKELLSHTDADYQILSTTPALLNISEVFSSKSKRKFLKNWKKWDKATFLCYDLGILEFKGSGGLLIPLHFQVLQSTALVDKPYYYILGYDPQVPVPLIQNDVTPLKSASPENEHNSKTLGDFLLAQRVYNALMKYQNSPIPTLNTIAAEANSSITSIKRAFKDRYGTSILNYDMEKRLEASIFLLQETNLDIGQVATQHGFKTSSHYISRFRAQYGVTPLQYRKKHYFKEN